MVAFNSANELTGSLPLESVLSLSNTVVSSESVGVRLTNSKVDMLLLGEDITVLGA